MALAALLLLGAVPDAAASCLAGSGPFTLDPASDDTLAPGPPGALVRVGVHRGHGPVTSNCLTAVSSGADCGLLHVSFIPAEDPDHAQEEVGYLLRQVDGTLPDGLLLPTTPIAARFQTGVAFLSVHWRDAPVTEKPTVLFTLAVTPVDIAGNRGPELEIVIDDVGRGPADPPDPECETRFRSR